MDRTNHFLRYSSKDQPLYSIILPSKNTIQLLKSSHPKNCHSLQANKWQGYQHQANRLRMMDCSRITYLCLLRTVGVSLNLLQLLNSRVIWQLRALGLKQNILLMIRETSNPSKISKKSLIHLTVSRTICEYSLKKWKEIIVYKKQLTCHFHRNY